MKQRRQLIIPKHSRRNNKIIKPSFIIPMRPAMHHQSPKMIRAMHDTRRQIMFHGPRNTSKSYTLWKLFCFYHEMIPYLQSFIVRNEAKTLSKTVLKTFLRMLKYPGAKDKRNPFEIVGGINFPQRILWANGGITELGGLDDPDKILGGDYHMGWYNEIQREKKEESFSNLMGCFVGERAGPLPSWVPWRYRMYMDCNPTSPAHFIYRRQKESEALKELGKDYPLEWYDVLHRDNPMLANWDMFGNFLGLNERGENNEKDLLEIYPEGYMRDRMVYGIPRGAEGMVYQEWQEAIHVKDMDRTDFIDGETSWRWSIDIGGRDPHAIGIFAHKLEDDSHNLFKEVAASGIKISDIIKKAEDMCSKYNIPKPSAVFLDHNVKEFDIQLEELGYPVVLADKEVLPGVETLKQAMADRKFFVNTHSLEERDPLRAGQPQGFKEEVWSYVHKPEDKRTGSPKDDLPDPTNKNKHSMDLARYYMHSLYLAPTAYHIDYSTAYGY